MQLENIFLNSESLLDVLTQKDGHLHWKNLKEYLIELDILFVLLIALEIVVFS